MTPPTERTYSAEAVEHILKQAVAEPLNEGFTHAQLLEMAEELNITPEVLAKAVQTWQTEKAKAAPNQNRSYLQKISRDQEVWKKQWGSYITVNTVLILLNLIVCGTISWAIYPLLGWGAGLLFGPCQRSSSSQKTS